MVARSVGVESASGGLVYSAFVLGVLNSVLLLVLLVLQIYLIFSLK
jgi:hypothetical protein